MKSKQYIPSDKMSYLIGDNYPMLQVLSRFDLPLGFGDHTVEEICKDNQVDCPTFLAVVNFICEDCDYTFQGEISVRSLMNYLKNAHHYFLDFQLPAMRRKLIEAIDCATDHEVAFLILKFYDAYVQEVRKHMNYEDMNVFSYVEGLLEGKKDTDYCIANFVRDHDQVDDKLTELKNIIIKYYPSNKNNYLLNAVLFDIFNCEKDLISHTEVENHLFVPAVLKLEKEVEMKPVNPHEASVSVIAESIKPTDAEEDPNGLSQREKEIVRCVVKGLSNKEIAEELYISVHTVITHRRNIARKLQIHSPTLLTIYAIVNKLVDISEVKMNL